MSACGYTALYIFQCIRQCERPLSSNDRFHIVHRHINSDLCITVAISITNMKLIHRIWVCHNSSRILFIYGIRSYCCRSIYYTMLHWRIRHRDITARIRFDTEVSVHNTQLRCRERDITHIQSLRTCILQCQRPCICTADRNMSIVYLRGRHSEMWSKNRHLSSLRTHSKTLSAGITQHCRWC